MDASNPHKDEADQKKRQKTMGELFKDLPTLPAGTRPPRVVSIATVDHVAIRFAEMLAKGYKLSDIDDKPD